MQERFDIVSRLPPEVAVGVLAALDSLGDVVKGAALVCRAWYALATHPALARLWYRRLLRPEPRLPDLSWTVRSPPPRPVTQCSHATRRNTLTRHARATHNTTRTRTCRRTCVPSCGSAGSWA
jgi:hypothetical protein